MPAATAPFWAKFSPWFASASSAVFTMVHIGRVDEAGAVRSYFAEQAGTLGTFDEWRFGARAVASVVATGMSPEEAEQVVRAYFETEVTFDRLQQSGLDGVITGRIGSFDADGAYVGGSVRPPPP